MILTIVGKSNCIPKARKSSGGTEFFVPHLPLRAADSCLVHCCHLSLGTSSPSLKSSVISVRCGLIDSVCGWECLVQKLSKFTLSPCPQEDSTDDSSTSVDHPLPIPLRWYYCSPSVENMNSYFILEGYFMLLLPLLLVQVRFQFHCLETYCRAKCGTTREDGLSLTLGWK